jgi:hypothetical protein
MIKGLFKDTNMDELDLTNQNTIANTLQIMNPIPSLNPHALGGETKINTDLPIIKKKNNKF